MKLILSKAGFIYAVTYMWYVTIDGVWIGDSIY
jgi:hypothetical protein